MTDIEQDLTTTHDALASIQKLLLDLSNDRGQMHPLDFANQAQGAVEVIHDLRKQIDDMIGMTAAEQAISEVNALIRQNLPIPGLPHAVAPVAKAS